MHNGGTTIAPNSSLEPVMNETYDLIVIGAGMAGIAAAKKGATHGWRVAIIDSLPMAGHVRYEVAIRRKSCGVEPKSSTAPGS